MRALLFALAVLTLPLQAGAAAWEHTLSLAAGIEFDSNPGLDPDGSTDVWRASFTPHYALSRSDGVDTLAAAARVRLERVSDDDRAQDREDPFLSLGWNRLLPRGELDLRAAYEETATRGTDFAFDMEGHPDEVAAEGTRRRSSVSAGWSHALTQRASLRLDARYGDVSYADVDFDEYRETGLSLSYHYELGPRTTVFVAGSGSRMDPRDGEDSKLLSARGGVQHQHSERLTWALDVGAARSRREGDSSNGQGGVRVDFRGERGQFGLRLGRTAVSSGASGSFRYYDEAVATASLAWSERDRGGLELAWREGRGIDAAELRHLHLWLGRELSPDWEVRLGYRLKQHKASGGERASAHVVQLSLVYAAF